MENKGINHNGNCYAYPNVNNGMLLDEDGGRTDKQSVKGGNYIPIPGGKMFAVPTCKHNSQSADNVH